MWDSSKAYVGGIMCLFGVDIMNDWLFQSRHLMSRSEYTLVWISFGVTWLCLNLTVFFNMNILFFP